MKSAAETADPHRIRPWLQLGLATLAQAASSAAVNAPAFLIPALHGRGLSLPEAGTVAAASTLGSTCTLAVWGAVVDAVGERLALTVSLAATALFLGVSMSTAESPLLLTGCLFLVGAASAGTASATGRVVATAFPAHRRGMAMGVRQMAQPLGVAFAAFAVPVAAARWGVGPALTAPLIFAAALAAACAVGIAPHLKHVDVAAHANHNPYSRSRYLARIHAASVLLVVPQFTVWTFMLVWLQVGRHWTPAAAGVVVAGAQVLGGIGRIASGQLSDMVGSRVRPLRWVAIAAAATMVLLGVSVFWDWPTAVPLMVLASVVTVADNGLAFTAVAEFAGPRWSGRALGIQNTGQYVAASFVPPVIGAAITTLGYGVTFGVTGLLPLAALAFVPREDQSFDERGLASARNMADR